MKTGIRWGPPRPRAAVRRDTQTVGEWLTSIPTSSRQAPRARSCSPIPRAGSTAASRPSRCSPRRRRAGGCRSTSRCRRSSASGCARGTALTVPISVLSKRPLRNFDLRDEDQGARPILGRADNRKLALTALLSASLDVLGDPRAGRPRRLADGGPAADRLRRRGARARGAGGVRRRRRVGRARCAPRCGTTPRVAACCGRSRPTTCCSRRCRSNGPDRRVIKYSYGEDFPLVPPWDRLSERYALSELLVARALSGAHVVSHRLPGGVAGSELPYGDRDPRGPAHRQRRARALSARPAVTAATAIDRSRRPADKDVNRARSTRPRRSSRTTTCARTSRSTPSARAGRRGRR